MHLPFLVLPLFPAYTCGGAFPQHQTNPISNRGLNPMPTAIMIPQEKAAGRPNAANNIVRASASAAISAAAARSSALIMDQIGAGISLGTTNDSLPDPCGPPDQLPGVSNSSSTCHHNVSVTNTTSKQYYGVHCLNDNTSEVLDQDACLYAKDTICKYMSGSLSTAYQITNKWIWSVQEGNCTFGYWLPEGGAPPPSYKRCSEQIMTPMNEACVGPTWNVGSINLKELPAANATAVTSTGKPVLGGWPSYIMVAQQGYWEINNVNNQ